MKPFTLLLAPVFLALLLIGLPIASAADFAPVQKLLDESVAQGTVVGGNVLVIHRGKVVFAKAFGVTNLKSKTPFQLDTPVTITSISKPLLGTVAFRLAQQKKVDLAAPITKYLPEFANAKLKSGEALSRMPTTLEFLTHTSGIPRAQPSGDLPWLASWTKGLTLEDVVKQYAKIIPFDQEPGTKFTYSGIGTDVAGRVLEVAASAPRNSLLLSEVAKPLGMKTTFYRDADTLKQVGVMPTRYQRGKDGKLRTSFIRHIPASKTYGSSGGTVISTAPDLARWLLMIRNDGRHEGKVFLTPATLTEMLSGFPNCSWARGSFTIREKDDAGKAIVIGHTGSSGTNCWIDFKNDLIGIMLTQTRGKDIKPFSKELEKRITACVAE